VNKLRDIPQDRKAEGCLIGSILLDPKVLPSVQEWVTTQHFLTSEAREIYGHMQTMALKGDAIDPVLVHARFSDKNRDRLFKYMCAAMDTVPSAANVVYYARRVNDKYIERELVCLVQHGTMALEDDGLTVDEKIHTIATMSSLAKNFGTENDLQTVSKMIMKLSSDLTAGGLRHTSTGFNAIDRIIDGIGAGQLVLVAGATSIGKTSMLLDIFIHLARIGQRPYYYYLEMLAAHLSQRLVMNIARVPKELVDAGSDAIRETIMLTEQWDAWIEPKPMPDIAHICTHIAAKKRSLDIGAAFIDHIQKIHAPGRGQVEQISYVSNALSLLACELKIPVVCACHVNRETLHRDNHIPKLSDLRGSGSLENDSDVVMILHRDDYYREQQEESPSLDGVAQCYVLKNRQGRKGIATLAWLPEYCSFADCVEETIGYRAKVVKEKQR